MEVICLETKAFYTLVDELYKRMKDNQQIEDKWVNSNEAMRLLNIKSKTTLQSLRDEGKIRFSQPQPRIILYDRDSINEHLDNHAKNTF